MKKRKIGDVAIEIMQEEGASYIGYNEYGMLGEVFARALKQGIVKEIGSRGGKGRSHPVNHHVVVLAALDRDKRFEKFFIRCCDRNGNSERLVREFKLKNSLTIACT